MATKVLVIRFSSIGDVVLTSPVLRCLKAQWPNPIEIHYLTKAVYVPLLEANPHIARLHTINDKVSEVLPELKSIGFEHVFDLHSNIRSRQVRKALGVPTISVSKHNIAKWKLVNMASYQQPVPHIVDRYLETASGVGIENDGLGLEHFIAPADEVDAAAIAGARNYLAVVVGATYATKALPPEQVVRVLDGFPHPVVVLGGPGDGNAGNYIAQHSNARVTNACGKFSIQQSASLVRQARKVLANDTGLMHIAAAFKKEIVSVWGSTVPQFGMTPYLPDTFDPPSIFEVQDLSCRPCSKLGYKKCPKKHFNCMMQQDTAAIRAALNW